MQRNKEIILAFLLPMIVSQMLDQQTCSFLSSFVGKVEGEPSAGLEVDGHPLSC